MYQNICVAVDGSELSFAAVECAAGLAKKLDANLIILHVIRNMKIPSELKRFVKQNSMDRLRQEALEGAGKEIIDYATEVANKEGVTSFATEILQGDPAKALVEGASRHNGDLLVVGTRGLGKVEGMLIGSISRKVTSISDINVLVVKPQKES